MRARNDRRLAGDHPYLETIVNVGATNLKGDSLNDPIHWIAALERQDGVWKIDVLTLAAGGGGTAKGARVAVQVHHTRSRREP